VSLTGQGNQYSLLVMLLGVRSLSGPDGSTAIVRRLRLDDKYVRAHRHDLEARAAAVLHRSAYSESGFALRPANASGVAEDAFNFGTAV